MAKSNGINDDKLSITPSKKSSVFREELNRLERRASAMERDIEAIAARPVLKSVLEGLFKDFIRAAEAEDRRFEGSQLRSTLNAIRHNVEILKGSIACPSRGIEYVSKLKESMQQIEASLVAFRRSMRERSESLESSEKRLFQDISGIEEKLRAIDVAPAVTRQAGSTSPTRISENSTASLEDEGPGRKPGTKVDGVRRFEEFVSANGGRTGGWDEADHRVFLNVWEKKKDDIKKVVEAFIGKNPTVSDQEVMRHIRWHQRYLRLLNDQRKSISEWREMKKVCHRLSELEHCR
ncbi:hypothetical protein BJ742DRAFT_115813 [Cladochytrium replicatum]|nr:hypothetical protein BJ742DRAFT_115813 [Cladochytrium replicatum]